MNRETKSKAELTDEEIEKAAGGNHDGWIHCEYYNSYICDWTNCALCGTADCVDGEYNPQVSNLRPTNPPR